MIDSLNLISLISREINWIGFWIDICINTINHGDRDDNYDDDDDFENDNEFLCCWCYWWVFFHANIDFLHLHEIVEGVTFSLQFVFVCVCVGVCVCV